MPNEAIAPRKRHRAGRIALAALLVLVCLVGALLVWCSHGYGADAEALAVCAEQQGGATEQGWATFGSERSRCGLVLYPGARVDADAYAPLLSELAERGVFCVLVDMPFDMAFFGIQSAAGVQEQFPQVQRWYLAGHSLGGAMASAYLGRGDNADAWEGLVLLAAYSTADLSSSGLDVLTVVGECDGVVNRDKLESCAANLPAAARTAVIPGGNHAQFGDYGAQSGDGQATISAHEQQEQTAELICGLMGV